MKTKTACKTAILALLFVLAGCRQPQAPSVTVVLPPSQPETPPPENEETYRIEYNLAGGAWSKRAVYPKDYKKSQAITLPAGDSLVSPGRGIFDGWYTDEACTENSRISSWDAGKTGAVSLWAKWVDGDKVTVYAEDFANKLKLLTKSGTYNLVVTGSWKKIEPDWESSIYRLLKRAGETSNPQIYVTLDFSGLTDMTDSPKFFECSSLKKIILPEGVKSIGSFGRCSNLEEIILPESLNRIGQYTFDYCKSLTTLICKAPNPPYLDPYVFYDYSSSLKFYVPADSVTKYKSAENWKKWASRINAIPQ